MTICAIKFPKCSLHGRTLLPPPLLGLPLFMKRTGNTCENGQNPDTDNTKCWWGCGTGGTLVFAGGAAKRLSHCPNFRRQFGSSYKIKHTLTKRSSNQTPCYVHVNWKLILTLNLSSTIYIALFIIDKNLEIQKCPWVNEWINNCGISVQWNSIQYWKQMSYEAIKINWRSLNVYD